MRRLPGDETRIDTRVCRDDRRGRAVQQPRVVSRLGLAVRDAGRRAQTLRSGGGARGGRRGRGRGAARDARRRRALERLHESAPPARGAARRGDHGGFQRRPAS